MRGGGGITDTAQTQKEGVRGWSERVMSRGGERRGGGERVEREGA